MSDDAGTTIVVRGPIPTLADVERALILAAMERLGSTSKAARATGISVRKIQYKLAEYRKETSCSAPKT